MNGGFGVAVGFLVADGAIADASLVGLGLGLRYYLGNIQHGAAAWRAAAEQQRDPCRPAARSACWAATDSTAPR